ncbi:(2Fe-2S)-binding protein [Roseomonas sp. F4]
MSERRITLAVNGQRHDITVPVRRNLADALRQDCGLTGTHLGCEHGVCGACTVLVDGRSARACLMLAVQAESLAITTVEGLTPDSTTLHPLQQAFANNHALQCGFCTPGMLTTLVELLAENPSPSAAEVRVAISGNLCRCTGYETIIAATLEAAAVMRGEAA